MLTTNKDMVRRRHKIARVDKRNIQNSSGPSRVEHPGEISVAHLRSYTFASF